MTFEEYQQGVYDTWNRSVGISSQEENAIYGLMGELGEFIEMYKKWKFHGIPVDRVKERKELGDIQYYLTALMSLRGYRLEETIEENHEKLKNRYPNGFVEGGGIR